MFSDIESALESFKNGEFLIVLDDESRENEGDLIIAGEKITTEKMAFLVRYSSGYVCAPMTDEIADKLELPLMVPNNTDRNKTAYTITVDYKFETSTGISAYDRALTVKNLANPHSKPLDFLRPGHIVPLRAVPGGLLNRKGHTEATVDLCKLSNLYPVGAIGELVRDSDGLMARRDDCLEFGRKHNLKVITIAELIDYLKTVKSHFS